MLENYCPALNYRPVRDNNYSIIFNNPFLPIYKRISNKHCKTKTVTGHNNFPNILTMSFLVCF